MTEESNGKNSKIEKNLERLYKTALEQEDDLEFFKAVNAYTEYALETPVLKAVIDEQMAERAARYAKLEEAEEQATKEMLTSKKKLFAIIKKKGLDTGTFARYTTFSHEPYTDLLKEIEAYEKGEILKGSYRSDNYEQYLFDIAANLEKLGYRKELGDMAVTQEQYRDYYSRINGTSGYWFAGNQNGSFIFSKTWPERFQQKTLLERERTLKKWGSAEKLVQLKSAFDAVVNNVSFWKITETKDDNPYAHLFKTEDMIDIGYMTEDLSHLMGQTRSDSPRKFRTDRLHASPLDRLNVVAFKSILQTLHNLLMPKIELEVERDAGSASVASRTTSISVVPTGTSAQKIKEKLERKLQLLRDCRHTTNYYQAVIGYHEYICGTPELAPVLSELIAEDKIAPVYLQEVFNDFLCSQFMKYEVPKGFQYPNFYAKEIEDKYKLMKNFAELMQSEYDAAKFPNQIQFKPNVKIIKTKRDDEFFYTQKLHNDIIEKLELEKPDPLKMIEHLAGLNKDTLDFDEAESVLHFAGKDIQISQRAQSDPHDLLVTLFKDKAKEWNTDEVLDDWKLGNDPTPRNKVYQAGKALNDIVAKETQIKDFLKVSTKKVFINKAYLPK